jgi:hypothetical protein
VLFRSLSFTRDTNADLDKETGTPIFRITSHQAVCYICVGMIRKREGEVNKKERIEAIPPDAVVSK